MPKGMTGAPSCMSPSREPGFKALGLRVESVTQLDALAASEGVAVEDLAEPGGGKIVRLTDPDGFRIEIVAGQSKGEASLPFADQPRNTVASRPRFRALVRLEPGPAHVRRIGHAVLKVRDFPHLGEMVQRPLRLPDLRRGRSGQGCAAGRVHALRPRGQACRSPHAVSGPIAGQPGLLHAAFEVANLDDLMLGHQHLKAAKREAAWGVGRHIMGSQVFDYWKDPFGNELEHWTDGDLLTAADPPQKMPMSAFLAVQWGSPASDVCGQAPPSARNDFLFHGADFALQTILPPPAQRTNRMKLATYTAQWPDPHRDRGGETRSSTAALVAR
jgi:hypothetical protein